MLPPQETAIPMEQVRKIEAARELALAIVDTIPSCWPPSSPLARQIKAEFEVTSSRAGMCVPVTRASFTFHLPDAV